MSKNKIKQSKKEYDLKLAIRDKIEKKYEEKIDGKSMKSFDRIGKYLKGKSYFFDRRIVKAHLDFEPLTKNIASGEEFCVVSGKNPSTSLHLGHLALFKFLRELQGLGAKVIVPLTDDESFIDGKVENLREGKRIAEEKIIRDLIALGFDSKRTSIVIHSDCPDLYKTSMFFGNHLTLSSVKTVFGKDSLDTPAKVFYRGAVQLSSILLPQLEEFGGKKHVLIPVGFDQHPYILLTRDIAKKVHFIPPSELVLQFLPSLVSPEDKMSSSEPQSAIFTDDDEKTVREKINKAYTGSVSSLAAHKGLGGIPDICPVFQILRFHCDDESFVEKIESNYKSGKLTSVELKKIVADFVVNMLKKHKSKREAITKDEVKKFKADIDINSI